MKEILISFINQKYLFIFLSEKKKIFFDEILLNSSECKVLLYKNKYTVPINKPKPNSITNEFLFHEQDKKQRESK